MYVESALMRGLSLFVVAIFHAVKYTPVAPKYLIGPITLLGYIMYYCV